jgi:putative tryptophan/tyrosine transport system substrate-binding protein
MLKEAVPRLRRFATLLSTVTDPVRLSSIVQEAGKAGGVEALPVNFVSQPEELERVFAEAKRNAADAMLVGAHPFFNAHRDRIVALALRHRLPALYEFRDFVEAGGLMCYGTDMNAVYHRLATYTDRILKGAKPAELPVEQPTKLELVINMKTAKALGLTIPPSLLLRADQVIE